MLVCLVVYLVRGDTCLVADVSMLKQIVIDKPVQKPVNIEIFLTFQKFFCLEFVLLLL